MFDDHWRSYCQSQDSAGKRTIKGPYFEDQKNSRKIPEIIFSQKTQEARRRSQEEPRLGKFQKNTRNYIFPEDSGS
jgi:hypothetical protein